MPELKTVPNKQKTQNPLTDLKSIRETTLKLLAYCKENDWAGYDPYDALNSRVFKALPFLNFKIARLVLTQVVKRSPINLRPLLLVPKTHNPKGVALFLSSLVRLRRVGLLDGDEPIRSMADRLLALRSPNLQYAAWGYSFDWQTRSCLVPKGSPNIICSTFAANALLDAYEQVREAQWLNAAISTADFLLDKLFWREGASVACFSYTPIERSQVHNANLLGASLLCRISSMSGKNQLLNSALDAARYSVSKQHQDGSWDYGEALSQRWIDNFHTGFNLVALRRIARYGGTTEFETSIRRGYEFFKDHFFREDGAPKYFHNATYPIDIHSVAQSVLTLCEFRYYSEENIDRAQSVLDWAMGNLWDSRGFFYFQQHPHFTVRTSFMRWSQTWMLLALATVLDGSEGRGESAP